MVRVDLELIGEDSHVMQNGKIRMRLHNKMFLAVYEDIIDVGDALNMLNTINLVLNEYSISNDGNKTYVYVRYCSALIKAGKKNEKVFDVGGSRPVIRRISTMEDRLRALNTQKKMLDVFSDIDYMNEPINELTTNDRKNLINDIRNHISEDNYDDDELVTMINKIEAGKGIV